VVGTVLGLLGGFFRGMVELVAVRSTEVILCLPPLLLALLVVTLLGAGVTTLIIALTILYVPGYARVVFAATLQVRALDFVTAQEAMGTHPLVILRRTILPNVMPPLLVQLSLTAASAMVLESGLSFLGLGVVPPAPSWGLMIRAARGAMDAAPLLLVWPSLALAGTILVFNLLCDRLRDAFDPRVAPTAGAGWLRHGAGRLLPGLVPEPPPSEALLDVRNLTIALWPGGAGPQGPRLDVVRDVSFQLAKGEVLALVGESGSGKTLTGLSLMGLLPNGIHLTAGSMRFADGPATQCDLAVLTEDAHRALRGSKIAMVFQDAGASLDPVHRIGDQVAEALTAHRAIPPAEVADQVVALLRRIGIPEPELRARSYPHELSGGQRQRAMIAMAIANRPRLLIADEPTTALDTTIQAQILALFQELMRADGEMGMIFISHNLAVVAEIADRICVMYAGEVVEEGPVAEVFAKPRHPYTAALMASVPERATDRLSAILGSMPVPAEVPAGCRFAPRCAHPAAACGAPQRLRPVGADHMSRCARWSEVT